MNHSFFTSESVCAGHPDKLCDRIADTVLDEALAADRTSRVAVEVLATFSRLVMAGEVSSRKKLDFAAIARGAIKGIGFTDSRSGFSYRSPINVYIHSQSPDISLGVVRGGAGDQGMMFGYAVNETDTLMPLPIALAHELARRLDVVKIDKLPYLRPDGKTEVTISYENGMPKSVERVIIAVPYDQQISKNQLKSDLYEFVVTPVLNGLELKKIPIKRFIVNGTGRWEWGGPGHDTGLTGRKIIVDSYGGVSRVGGGCFSGKDATKVDRSGAYAARYIAKNIVGAKLADRCEVQLAYVIGYPKPIAKSIDTFGTEKKKLRVIEAYAWKLLDLSVQGIIESLNLSRSIYAPTSCYGHFGNKNYPWEQLVSDGV